MSLVCAACGPGSVFGQPHPASQCVLSRDGFDLWQIALYLKCTGCNNKYSLDCLRKLTEKVREYDRSLSDGESIHDPQGVWKTLKAQPWQDGTDAKVHSECCAAGFQPKTSAVCATVPYCFACEQGTIPEPAFSEPEQVVKASGADCELRAVLLLPFEEQLVSGDMAEPKVSVIDFVEAHPVLPTEHCKRVFQGAEGTEAVVGRARSAHPRPRRRRHNPTPPRPAAPCSCEGLPQALPLAHEPACASSGHRVFARADDAHWRQQSPSAAAGESGPTPRPASITPNPQL